MAPRKRDGFVRVFAKALFQTHLDLSFTSGGYQVSIYERPGLWMDADAREALSAQLRTIASSTLEAGELNYGVFAADQKRLSETTITLVTDRKTGAPVAFNALAHMLTHPDHREVEVIHLGLVMVDPDVRSGGLSWILYGMTCVLLFVRAGLRPSYISNVTQVPAVIGMVSETFSNVAPTPNDPQPRDFRKIQIARAIMASHRYVFGVGEDADFDDTAFIIRNAYTGGSDDLKKTFAQTAKHRDESYNSWCEAVLDYRRGDDVLQIGQIDLAAAQRYVFRTVPRRSLLSVLLLGVIVSLQRVAVPTLRWLDVTRDFGRLRAR